VVPACALSATFLAVQDLGGVTLRQSIGRCHSPFLAASGCSAIKSNSRLCAALITQAWYLNRIALRLGAALALTTYGAQHGARYLLFAALAEFVSGVHAVAFFLVLA
jgi:hypothetical protein